MPDARHTRDGTKGEGNDVQKLHVFALISAAQALRVALKGVRTEGPRGPDISLERQRPAQYMFSRRRCWRRSGRARFGLRNRPLEKTRSPQTNNREVAAMHKDARKYLERAAECARLAEGVEHPELKLYLANLAASWTKVAAETVEAQLPDA
jgi:hypothetical protein